MLLGQLSVRLDEPQFIGVQPLYGTICDLLRRYLLEHGNEEARPLATPSHPPRTALTSSPLVPPPVAPSRAPRPLAPSQVRRKAEAAVGLLATTSDGESAAHGLVDLMPKKKELLETAIAQAKAEAEALKEATAHYTAVELGSPHSS